jgi:hypothetical protein
MQQCIARRSQRIQCSAFARRQRQLADHLCKLEGCRIQANKPRRSLCLHAQGNPGFRFIIFGEEEYFNPLAVLGELPSYGFQAVWEGQDAVALQGDPPQGGPGGDSAPQAEDASLASMGASEGSGDTSQGNDAITSGVAYVSPSEGSSDESIIALDWV